MAKFNSTRRKFLKTPEVTYFAFSLLISCSGRQVSSNGMIFGAAYSHTDMLKMGYKIPLSMFVKFRISSNSNLITAPPTAVNNLTIPTSYSDFMDQTEDGRSPRRVF